MGLHSHAGVEQAARDAGNDCRAGAGAAGQRLAAAAFEYAQADGMAIDHLGIASLLGARWIDAVYFPLSNLYE